MKRGWIYHRLIPFTCSGADRLPGNIRRQLHSQPSFTRSLNNNLGRPPSHTSIASNQLGAPASLLGRPHSPMPPPINTGVGQPGYPPNQVREQASPPPPGYPQAGAYAPCPTAPPPAAQYRRGGAVEVDDGGKSGAQLIVGIDFVSSSAVKTSNVGFTNLVKQGTTFSGVAFAFATNNKAKEDIIIEWLGPVNQTKQKVRHSRNSGYLKV